MTPKMAAFVREYLVDLNATQAVIRAGYKTKYPQQAGSENLLKPVIAAAIKEALGKREKRTEITQDRVLKEISLVAFLDPLDLFAKNGTLLPLKKMPEHARRAIAGLDVEETFTGTGKDRKWTGYLKKIKLVSKEGTLTLAGRHLKMFTDKAEISGSLQVTQVDLSRLSDEEITTLQALLKKASGVAE